MQSNARFYNTGCFFRNKWRNLSAKIKLKFRFFEKNWNRKLSNSIFSLLSKPSRFYHEWKWMEYNFFRFKKIKWKFEEFFNEIFNFLEKKTGYFTFIFFKMSFARLVGVSSSRLCLYKPRFPFKTTPMADFRPRSFNVIQRDSISLSRDREQWGL